MEDAKVKLFSQLTEAEKQSLYAFVSEFGPSPWFDNYAEMCTDLSGVVFNQGCSHFSLWREGQIRGTMGAITREVRAKGEAYISGIHIKEAESEVFIRLLQESLSFIKAHKPKTIRLGIPWVQNYLVEDALQSGFRQVYQVVVMAYQGQNMTGLPVPQDFKLIDLDDGNKESYLRIHNDAFVASPNGALLAQEDLAELVTKSRQNPGMIGLMMREEEPVALFELKLRERIGWIETLAVDPWVQGQGLGKALLHKVLARLLGLGIDDIKLVVVTANQRAVKLYTANGFTDERVVSIWFELDSEGGYDEPIKKAL